MKTYLIIPALFILASCSQSLPDAPPSHRTVVQPKGSTDTVKSWSHVTKQESDAVLPFDNMRR